jgi:hypothetical protein
MPGIPPYMLFIPYPPYPYPPIPPYPIPPPYKELVYGEYVEPNREYGE